jgi:segregation and condensation protein B
VGRPALFATTKHFLDDLGLASLDQLPLLDSPAQQAQILQSLQRDANDQELVQADLVSDDLGFSASAVPVDILPLSVEPT